jgi:hypothetical protein
MRPPGFQYWHPSPSFALNKGENLFKVPLFKGDLGGSESGGEIKKTRPNLP